ncbi:MAG: hypothetical protein KDC45_04445 [Bacteroidetes bacterium]|nr:hypothetical protein [Bacteroidota bacterium]
MFDRIKFQIKSASVFVSMDPFFPENYILFHEVGDEIRVLERDLMGFEVKDEIRIYDKEKRLLYDIQKKEDKTFSITVEEMALDTLLNFGLSREALDQIILLKKRIINPR